MKINKIYVFEDRTFVIPKVEDLVKFKEEVCKVLKSKDLGIDIDHNIAIYKYGQTLNTENKYEQAIMSEEDEKKEEWMRNLNSILCEKIENILVFCDYSWGAAPDKFFDLNKEIFKCIRQKGNIIFSCYSTLMWENAQAWVEDLLKTSHKCRIIPDVFTSSNEFVDFLTSTKEAILYEWESI